MQVNPGRRGGLFLHLQFEDSFLIKGDPRDEPFNGWTRAANVMKQNATVQHVFSQSCRVERSQLQA